ncbi:MAG: Peptidase sortase, partial [Acidimicrobiales bacterium]|nr:Peptidase sortase [Acidimicrobiales bacterium]
DAPPAGSPLGRVQVPARGIDVVAREGASADQLDRGPGHVVGTAYPGGRGNAVIAGHRVSFGGPFAHLDRLRAGDMVRVTAPWGTAAYRVRSTGSVAAPAVDLGQQGPDRLTLVTSAAGLRLDRRLVVRADLVSPANPAAPPARAHEARLGAVDDTTVLLLGLWVLAAGALLWAIRLLRPRWGRIGAVLVVSPLLAPAAVGAFHAAAHLLPATL